MSQTIFKKTNTNGKKQHNSLDLVIVFNMTHLTNYHHSYLEFRLDYFLNIILKTNQIFSFRSIKRRLK